MFLTNLNSLLPLQVCPSSSFSSSYSSSSSASSCSRIHRTLHYYIRCYWSITVIHYGISKSINSQCEFFLYFLSILFYLSFCLVFSLGFAFTFWALSNINYLLLSTSLDPRAPLRPKSKFATDPWLKTDRTQRLIPRSARFRAFAMHVERRGKGGIVRMRKATPRRAAQDMFTVTVHDRRVDDPAARLMVIIRERGRSERCGVVKRWFRPSLVDPVAKRRQSRDAESPIYVEICSRMPSYFIERIIYRSGAGRIIQWQIRIPRIFNGTWSVRLTYQNSYHYLSAFNFKIIAASYETFSLRSFVD